MKNNNYKNDVPLQHVLIRAHQIDEVLEKIRLFEEDHPGKNCSLEKSKESGITEQDVNDMVSEGLKEVGLSALPSATNFMFVDLGNLDAEAFRQKMAQKNVHIRGIYRDYTNWSRVSMGRLEHVQMYVDALPAVLEEMNA